MGYGFVPDKAHNDRPIKKIALAGHSYISRLRLEQNLYAPSFIIRKFAAPGATVASFPSTQAWKDLVNYQPDVTFLILGGNDVNRETVPLHLAKGLADIALRLEAEAGGTVRVVGLEVRENPRDCSPDRFKRIRNAVNRALLRDKNIKSRFLPMYMDPADLDFDGVHLDSAGSRKLTKWLIDNSTGHVYKQDLEDSGKEVKNLLDLVFVPEPKEDEGNLN